LRDGGSFVARRRGYFDAACSKPLWRAAYLAGLAAANTTMRGCGLKGMRLGSIDLENSLHIHPSRRHQTDSGCFVEFARPADLRLYNHREPGRRT
jgi:hypothetical protein